MDTFHSNRQRVTHTKRVSEAQLGTPNKYHVPQSGLFKEMTPVPPNQANLNGADLSNADLSNAKRWTEKQLTAAEFLDDATMPNGQKYEDWLKSRGANRENSGPS